MNIRSSRLFKSLQFCRKFENFFKDAFDIYFYIYGYDEALVNKNLPEDQREDWVYNFLIYIRERLEEIYSPNTFNLWYNHFGEMISIIEEDKKKGIELFYKLLDEFAESQEWNPSNP